MASDSLWQKDLLTVCPWMDRYLSNSTLLPLDNALLNSKRRSESIRRAEAGNIEWNRWAREMTRLRVAHPDNKAIQFAATTDWQAASFTETVDLAGCLFPGSIQADDAIFFSEAFFTGLEVYGDVNLRNAQFSDRGLWLDQAKIYGSLRLNRAFLGGRVELRSSVIARTADFAESRFAGDLWATHMRFMGPTDVSYCRFRKDAVFHSSRFEARADFTESEFKSAAGFEKCRFDNIANFEGCHFHQKVWMNGAHFHDAARIGSARFRDEIKLDGVRFEDAKASDEIDILQDVQRANGISTV